MNLLNYPKNFVSVGTDILDNTKENYGISFIDNRYMLSSPERVIFTDAELRNIEEVYDVVNDPELRSSLKKELWGELPNRMLIWGRAFMQDYTHRLTSGQLTLTQ